VKKYRLWHFAGCGQWRFAGRLWAMSLPAELSPQDDANARKDRARAWFESLRDRIVADLEALEREAPDTLYPGVSGTFEKTSWSRPKAADGEDQGGGVMGIMRGRLFEKVGVHTSTVFGSFAPDFAAEVKGAKHDPRFWASGISLICHPRNPHVPPVHINTRMMVTTQAWFGGIADLNPVLDTQRDRSHSDAVAFHARLKQSCDAFEAGAYGKYAKWADEYFWLPHRGEPRGVGGIFYDHLDTGDWERDFTFTQSIGHAFSEIYPAIVRNHIGESWTDAQRREQAKWRGRYVEFNLLYDRGTTFGLKTGGNVESILSSMPPTAQWP
jgi:coproporphyrinogen III oxidase